MKAENRYTESSGRCYRAARDHATAKPLFRPYGLRYGRESVRSNLTRARKEAASSQPVAGGGSTAYFDGPFFLGLGLRAGLVGS